MLIDLSGAIIFHSGGPLTTLTGCWKSHPGVSKQPSIAVHVRNCLQQSNCLRNRSLCEPSLAQLAGCFLTAC